MSEYRVSYVAHIEPPQWEVGKEDRTYAECYTQADAERIARALQVLDAQEAPVGWCHWTEDENGAWQTACGHMFEFTDGGPTENKQQFCGYCGLLLHEVPVTVEPQP